MPLVRALWPPFLLVALALASCSAVLGLADPQLYPAEAGAPEQDATTPVGDASAGKETGSPPTCRADLESDARNCGTCGHDCGRGTCKSGACQPFLLVDLDTESATAVVVDDTYLYVGALDRPLFRVTKADAFVKPSTVMRGVDGLTLGQGGLLYWSTLWKDGGAEISEGVAGGVSNRIAYVGRDGFGSVRSLVATNGFGGSRPVAWIDQGRGHVAVPGPELMAPLVLTPADTGERDSIHLVGDALYWTESGAQQFIGRLKRAETTPKRWDLAPLRPVDFAIAGEEIVFVTSTKISRGRFGINTIDAVEDLGDAEYPPFVQPDGERAIILSRRGLVSCAIAGPSKLLTTLVEGRLENP